MRRALIASLLALVACSDDPAQAPSTTTVTLFHTNDEHGYLQPDSVSDPAVVRGGAANVRAWLADAGYDPEQHLLLSSGDNWSGPAISSWVEGESAAEVFAAMGYDATAIGNHEFDYGLDVLDERIAAVPYAHLSANVLDAQTGGRAPYGLPYVVLPAGDVMVGIIGLTTTTSPTSAHPKYVRDFTFEDYVTTLETYVPLVRDEGAEVVVVLAHVCLDPLAQALLDGDFEVHVALAGHCHAKSILALDQGLVVESSQHLGGFTRIDITLDASTRTVIEAVGEYTDVAYPAGTDNPVTPDPEIAELVDMWQARIDEDLDEVIGFTEAGFDAGSWKRANWVVDAWLAEYGSADVALVNFGSLRGAVAVGDISIASVVGLMPFENSLVSIDLTGAQIQETILNAMGEGPRQPGVGGMTYVVADGSVSITLDDGVFDPAATYTLLTTDFLYYGGGDYAFATFDETPDELDVHMRDPVIAWTRALMTSPSDPIEDHVDAAPRNE